MNAPEDDDGLAGALRDRVLARLGFARAPAADLDGLRALYAAWCAGVPFDNVRKVIALRGAGDRPLPGGHAEEFFEHWLRDGAGGTCWPTSNALVALARALGFEAHRLVGWMRDLGFVNHASARVRVGPGDWLVDSSLLTNVPLPLGGAVFVHDDPVFAAEVEPDGAAHVVWADTPPNPAYLPCRVFPDPVDHARYLAGHEESRARGPFNQRLYARRNHPGALVVLLGRTRFAKTAAGLESRDLSPAELCQALGADIGLSERLVREWAACGDLAAAFEPPAGPKPPPVTREPPSRRRAG